MVLLPLVWAIVTPYLGEYVNCPSAEWTHPKLRYQWIGTPNVGQFTADQSSNNREEQNPFIGTT